MGIPHLLGSWLYARIRRRKIRGIRFKMVPKNVRTMSFDLNGLIHNARSIVYGRTEDTLPDYHIALSQMSDKVKERRILETVGILLHGAIMKVGPTFAVIIAVDGPTNLAKIKQQRSRRYMSAAEAHKDDPDPASVTPGTPFMAELHTYLKGFIEKHRSDFPKYVYYSSHLDPGEGEHKIMSLLRSGKFSKKTPEGVEVGTHIIYGLDADLAILSLINSQKNIFLARERLDDVISIEGLKRMLIEDAPPHLKDSVVRDFVAMITLLGNDFLPHGPLHQSMYPYVEYMVNSYFSLHNPLTIRSGEFFSIDFSSMAKLVSLLPKRESELVAEETSKRMSEPDKYYPSVFDEKVLVTNINKFNEEFQVFDWNIFRSVWYNREFGYPSDGIPVGLSGTMASPDNIENMCMDYIQGMSWIFRYYQTINVDSLWMYKYNHAPLMIDLGIIMSKLSRGYGDEMDSKFAEKFSLPYGAVEQLLMVIPHTNRSNIPGVIQHVYDDVINYGDLFPRSFKVECDGISKEESFLRVPIITPIAYEKIINITRDLKPYLGAYDHIRPFISISTESEYTNYISRIKSAKEKYSKSRLKEIRTEKYRDLQENIMFMSPAGQGESGGRGRGRGRGRGEGRGGRGGRGRGARGRGGNERKPVPTGDIIGKGAGTGMVRESGSKSGTSFRGSQFQGRGYIPNQPLQRFGGISSFDSGYGKSRDQYRWINSQGQGGRNDRDDRQGQGGRNDRDGRQGQGGRNDRDGRQGQGGRNDRDDRQGQGGRNDRDDRQRQGWGGSSDVRQGGRSERDDRQVPPPPLPPGPPPSNPPLPPGPPPPNPSQN
jgi:hypothetical protein